MTFTIYCDLGLPEWEMSFHCTKKRVVNLTYPI